MRSKADFKAYLDRIFAKCDEVTSDELPLDTNDDVAYALMLAVSDEVEVEVHDGYFEHNGRRIPYMTVSRCR